MRHLRKTLALIFGAALLIAATEAVAQQPGDCGYYVNRSGNTVSRPCGNRREEAPPQGTTATCRDGTYSYSQHHSGTCSGHGGVQSWGR
jgi:hypothetical protein